MAEALVVYATRKGETKNIADLISEGIRFEGSEAASLGGGIQMAQDYGRKIGKKLKAS